MLPRGGPLGSDAHVITVNIIIIIIRAQGSGVVSYLQAGEGCCLPGTSDNPPLDVLISSGELHLLKGNSEIDAGGQFYHDIGVTTSTVVREVSTLELKYLTRSAGAGALQYKPVIIECKIYL